MNTIDINRAFTKFYQWVWGVIASIVGYFSPIKDIVVVLIIFFMLDVLFGFWAARKMRHERFSVKIIWSHTMPRMLVSIVLILGAYMWDMTYNQTIIHTYKIIGWFISGMLLYSIAENGYYITRWGIFKKLGKTIKDNLKR